MNLTSELAKLKEEIRGYAIEADLDFFETVFEMVDAYELNAFAAYAGFPTRYPHWRFGMEFEELAKSYTYGLAKIYEMVINNDPCYAYLMKSNSLVDQKLVMAHVYAHSDFFKNNMWFSKTNRKMMDQMANHAVRIRRYIDRYGEDTVEDFVDACLSLENLIDPHSVFKGNGKVMPKPEAVPAEETTTDERFKLNSPKGYLDSFINPPQVIEQQKAEWAKKASSAKRRVPAEPQHDVLAFLLDYAPLEPWQHEVLSIIRDEAYYLAPQGQTKIMNEGWATYWHSKIMTTRVLQDSEVIDYADHHSGTVATSPGRLNPYKLGVELFKDIEDRWNKGKFGKEFDDCDDYQTRRNWNRQQGLGREKIFEVRRLYNDVMFIDAFLTADFVREHDLFAFDYNKKSGYYEISDRDFHAVKQKLLFSLTNWGQPFIFVQESNYKNRGELVLWHRHEGIDLKLDEARDTLQNLYKIWSRPVHLETVLEGKKAILSFDGENHESTEIE